MAIKIETVQDGLGSRFAVIEITGETLESGFYIGTAKIRLEAKDGKIFETELDVSAAALAFLETQLGLTTDKVSGVRL